MIGECSACAGRTRVTNEFCPPCWRRLGGLLYTRHRAPRRVRGLSIVSAGPYCGMLQDYLLHLKRQVLPRSTTLRFLEEILGHWAPELSLLGANAIAPVPRSYLRGSLSFDVPRQMALMLSRQLKIPVLNPAPRKNFLHDLLHGPQKSKELLDRIRNPPQFTLTRSSVPRRSRVLLVDDLCSTGASLNSLRRSLADAEHSCVGAFCLLDNDSAPDQSEINVPAYQASKIEAKRVDTRRNQETST